MQKIAKWALRLWGFKITGKIDTFPNKVVYAVIPHTSNWDFLLGILVRSSLQLNLKYLAKDSLFKPPLGFIFKALGGIPVDRSKKTNFVDAVVETLKRYDNAGIAMAPEGTRKRVDKLKSGFYWMAHKAQIPLIFVKFDYKNKAVNFSDPYYPTGDYEKDLNEVINPHFKGVEGKNKENSYRYGVN